MKIYLVNGRRTPFGRFQGSLSRHSATDLAVLASEAALEAAAVPAESVDAVVFGNVQQTSADAAYLARHVGLRAGLRIETPALTLNRLCGSGIEAVASAARMIRCGEAEVVLAGGTESMTQAPHVARGLRGGVKLGKSPALEDSLWTGLTDSFCRLPMGGTAEKLAGERQVSREDADAYALQAQQRFAAADEAGRFAEERITVDLGRGKTLSVDEHARPDTTLEKLAALPPVFAEGGVVSAGNASGICDGAAALLVASEAAVERLGLTPLACIESYAAAGVRPDIMGIGPVPALKEATRRADCSLDDCELIDVNEAFAAQVVAVARELELDQARLNVDGGAIALGHPLGASGARILLHLALQLRDRKLSRVAASACIGGGQGIAMLLKAV